MSFPKHNHVGEPLFCYDDVTNCGDVSSSMETYMVHPDEMIMST